MTSLNIGSGGKCPEEGWYGIDLFTDCDIKTPMWDLNMFENESVEEIYSSHSLEHISKHQVMPTLKEWFRVLQHGGKLHLLVPDLEWCCKHWIEHQNDGWDLDIIFGHQAHDGEYHKTGFSKQLLHTYMGRVGMVIDSIDFIPTHGQQTIEMWAHKP